VAGWDGAGRTGPHAPTAALSIVGKVLAVAGHGEGQALRRLIAEALREPREAGARPGGVMRITRPSGRAPYEVLVAPLSERSFLLGFGGPLAVVFLRDPEARPVAPLDRLRRLYGLTGAEARLVQGLLAGFTLDAIADQAGVTKETLRSQLKSVFLKTGASSQGELIRLGLRGLGAWA
jgi:DNA-binding CsgD family transcriptional regulator